MGVGAEALSTVERIKVLLRRDLKLGDGARIADDMVLAGGEVDLGSLGFLRVGQSLGKGVGGRLAHADVRFDAAVRPPAEIRLWASVTRTLGRLVQFEVRAEVGGLVVARGSLALAAAGPPAENEVRP